MTHAQFRPGKKDAPEGSARGQVPGILPKAGDKLPAIVMFEYGGGVVDLRVQLRGTANHFIQNVAQGTAGQQGRWAVRALRPRN